MTITSQLKMAAHRQGGKIAVRCGAAALTYERLYQASERLAGALSAKGIGRGNAFAAQGYNSIAFLALYYAAARLGAVFVPLNRELSAYETSHIVEHIDARELFHDDTLAELFAQLPMSLDEATAPGDLEEDFLVIYTSGSTGAPKAVVFNQAREIAGNRSLIEMWGIGPEDVTLVALPLGFLYGLSTAAATGLQAGGEVVLLRRFHPADVLNSFVDQRISVYHGVPTMFAMMLDYAEQHDLDIDLSPVRLLISAGAPLGEPLRRRFQSRFNKSIDDYYALTEVRPILGKTWNDPRPIPEGSPGRLAPGTEAIIADADGHAVAQGEHGELIVRAPGMFSRYHRDQPLTQAALRDGWFRTGDLCRQDGSGNYFITGRLKDIIIRGGANIAPAEIENVLARHPGVKSAAVIGVPNEKYGEVPVAYVVARGALRLDAEDLGAFCARELASFKLPSAFVTLEALPLGPTGKIDRKALKEAWAKDAARCA